MLWNSATSPYLSLDRDVVKGDDRYIFPRLVLGFSIKCPVCGATEWQRQHLELPVIGSTSSNRRVFEIPPIIETVEALVADRAKSLVGCSECGTDGRLPSAEQAKILAYFGMDIEENPELARAELNPDQSQHLQNMLVFALKNSEFTVDPQEGQCWPTSPDTGFHCFNRAVLP